jgi:hypothetical protein
MKTCNYKDDYKTCLQKGQEIETKVQGIFNELFGLTLERNDTENLSNPDFKLNIQFDLKFRFVPFRKAKQYTGLESWEALPINVNKLEKYDKNSQTFIFFVVDYSPECHTKGVYYIDTETVWELYKRYPERIHTYKDRYDDNKNAKQSFYVSVKECYKLSKDLVDKIRR